VGLAAACLHEGLVEEAESAYRRTLELQPQHPDVVAGLVRIVAETARVGEAVELLRVATAAHPDSAALRSVLAFMLNYAGGDAQERFEAHLAFGRLIPSKPRPRPGQVPNTPTRIAASAWVCSPRTCASTR
jgi:Flp pilus assembly protein TadD